MIIIVPIFVAVYVIPQLIALSDTPNRTLFIGSNTSLPCEFESTPTTFVTWTKINQTFNGTLMVSVASIIVPAM